MIILGYIGDHKKDGWRARFGWWLVRLVQRGEFKQVTHVEALLEGTNYRLVTIGSSSLRDGGVRTKTTDLTPGHWIAVEVGRWDELKAKAWFKEFDGEGYDWRGAMATVLFWMGDVTGQWFCNEAVGAAVGLRSPEQYTPCRFMAIAMSMHGKDVTKELFKGSEVSNAV